MRNLQVSHLSCKFLQVNHSTYKFLQVNHSTCKFLQIDHILQETCKILQVDHLLQETCIFLQANHSASIRELIKRLIHPIGNQFIKTYICGKKTEKILSEYPISLENVGAEI